LALVCKAFSKSASDDSLWQKFEKNPQKDEATNDYKLKYLNWMRQMDRYRKGTRIFWLEDNKTENVLYDPIHNYILQMNSPKAPPQHELILLVVGEPAVGKTSLLQRMLTDDFDPYPVAPSTNKHKISITINQTPIVLHLWDESLSYSPVWRDIYNRVQGFFLCYDIIDYESYRLALTKWLPEIKRNGAEDLSVMLVGTNTDLEYRRRVLYEEAHNYCEEHGIPNIEVSSKQGRNVHVALGFMVCWLLDKFARNKSLGYYPGSISVAPQYIPSHQDLCRMMDMDKMKTEHFKIESSHVKKCCVQ